MKDEKESLIEKTASPDFWNNPEEAKKINLRLEAIHQTLDPFETTLTKTNDLLEIVGMADSQDSLLEEVASDLQILEKNLRQLELKRMLSGDSDHLPAIVSINAGSGGTEAQDWAQMLQRMFLRYANKKEFSVEIVDEQAGEGAGIKSCSFICRGEKAYGYFKSERGVHRLVRISPFDANKRRHTSFAAVDVLPEVDETIKIEIRPEEIKMDTYRSGGAGGQHVNKTDSAVRLTHLPTGVVVACQSQRSQHQNRATAMTMLKSKLYEMELAKRQAQLSAHHAQKKEITWGSQIRSYILAPYKLVKDHRTEYESFQPEKVLDGELEDFAEAYLLSINQ